MKGHSDLISDGSRTEEWTDMLLLRSFIPARRMYTEPSHSGVTIPAPSVLNTLSGGISTAHSPHTQGRPTHDVLP
jgi:hypothetical protein